MNIKLLQLSYFKALAEKEHLMQTANELFISAPALSSSISILEDILGVKLFDHVGRNIRLNENGKIVYNRTKIIFNELELMQNELKEANSFIKQDVNIATTALALWSEGIISCFDHFPNVSINHSSLKLDKLHTTDTYNKYDFIITDIREMQSDKWEYKVITKEDNPVLCVSKNHHLASRSEVSLTELKNEPFIAVSKGYASRKYFDSLFELAGFTPKIILECEYTMRARAVKAGHGATITTTLGSKAPIFKGLKIIKITHPISPRIQTIFWKKGEQLSSNALAIRDHLISYYSKK